MCYTIEILINNIFPFLSKQYNREISTFNYIVDFKGAPLKAM